MWSEPLDQGHLLKIQKDKNTKRKDLITYQLFLDHDEPSSMPLDH